MPGASTEIDGAALGPSRRLLLSCQGFRWRHRARLSDRSRRYRDGYELRIHSRRRVTCWCQALGTRGPRRTPQGHLPLPSVLDARRGRACSGPRSIGSFRCRSSTIPQLTAIRKWDRRVSRQWAAGQKVVPGLRYGMSVCCLMVQEPAEAAAVVSGLRESAASTLATVSRRSVPESAIEARASRRRSITTQQWSTASSSPTRFAQFAILSRARERTESYFEAPIVGDTRQVA